MRESSMLSPKASAPAVTAASAAVIARSPGPQATSSLGTLARRVKAAIDAEREAGHSLCKDQDPESLVRLRSTIQELIKEYALTNSGDWRHYAFFNDLHYVRNLVALDEDFEIIVLCWKPGQVSRVHNHGTSHCFLGVLDGQMREIQYQPSTTAPPTSLPAGTSVEVMPTRTTDMKVGDVGYINDNLCLHSVGCHMDPAACNGASAGCQPCAREGGLEGGVTLHLYAPPIRKVKIFEEGHVVDRAPGFYSVNGIRV